jgi:hypothetical protein
MLSIGAQRPPERYGQFYKEALTDESHDRYDGEHLQSSSIGDR